MADECCVIDFCEFQQPLLTVYAQIRDLAADDDTRELLSVAESDEPDRAFYLVAEAFDNYREAYVQKGDVGAALLDLAKVAVLARGVK